MPSEDGSGTGVGPGAACNVAVNVPPKVITSLMSSTLYPLTLKKIWKGVPAEVSNARPPRSSSVLGGLYRRLLFPVFPQQSPASCRKTMLLLSKLPEIPVMVNGEVAPVVVNVPEPLWCPSPPYVQLYCAARACVPQVTNAAKTAPTCVPELLHAAGHVTLLHIKSADGVTCLNSVGHNFSGAQPGAEGGRQESRHRRRQPPDAPTYLLHIYVKVDGRQRCSSAPQT